MEDQEVTREKLDLFFDTETSNLPSFKKPPGDPSQAWVVQLAVILSTRDKIVSSFSILIKSDGRPMNSYAEAVHLISTNIADEFGLKEVTAAKLFSHMANRADNLVAHNIKFDDFLMKCLMTRCGLIDNLIAFESLPRTCTMMATTQMCRLPKKRGGGYKWPKLTELYHFLFGETFEGAHDAMADVVATRRCYYELVERGIIGDNN